MGKRVRGGRGEWEEASWSRHRIRLAILRFSIIRRSSLFYDLRRQLMVVVYMVGHETVGVEEE